jgi:hypothetical protein
VLISDETKSGRHCTCRRFRPAHAEFEPETVFFNKRDAGSCPYTAETAAVSLIDEILLVVPHSDMVFVGITSKNPINSQKSEELLPAAGKAGFCEKRPEVCCRKR